MVNLRKIINKKRKVQNKHSICSVLFLAGMINWKKKTLLKKAVFIYYRAENPIRRVGWGWMLIFSCDEYIFILVFQFLAVECIVPELPDLHLQLLIRSNCHSKKNLSIIDCEFVPRSVFGLPLKAESLNYR